ncbi:unnamed protein product [Blepharisma stoltei]|uniref:Uncharacterized protein n=1 Tax=Blepharisma stoltei TaxID=1481888 RepID=A0AAU9IHV7_9CILI|nr:unnamed protein product [Blepharisma stoltei]
MDSNENNNSVLQETQQFSPVRLSFVDEKEAKEISITRRKSSVASLTSYLSDNSSQNSPVSKSRTSLTAQPVRLITNSNNNIGLDKSRFISQVDEHFICKLCSYVVRDPVECDCCENLICQDCWFNFGHCPHGCSEFATKKLAKYAASVYSNFTLKCKNHILGCPYSGPISKILSHEEDCLYVFIKCQNPLCEKQLLKAEKYEDPDSLLVCCDTCRHIVEFSNENFEDPIDVLKSFAYHLDEAKKIIEAEIQEKMKEKIQKIAKDKKLITEANSENERLQEKIHKRISFYHSGRWNVNSRLWSCCGNTNKYANGCREID